MDSGLFLQEKDLLALIDEDAQLQDGSEGDYECNVPLQKQQVTGKVPCSFVHIGIQLSDGCQSQS